ncbi:MAG TPA: threonine/serine dehydratase [Stellaceae bacterium]|nr:threonine/serine dehydratase [Stellaceae bacterium]
MTSTPDLAAIRAAAAAVAGKVRRTPMIPAELDKVLLSGRVLLKLECLQVTGSFKARGALNTLSALTPAEIGRGIITASGGNHGLAVAYAGYVAKTPATIFLPKSVPPAKIAKLEAWSAKTVVEGAVWDDANRGALAQAAEKGLTYIHPFADPRVIAGQGTLGLELLEQAPDLDTVLVAIGGGGLISGVALAVKAMKPSIKVIGIEPTGAPTLYESVRAHRLVELQRIDTAAGTLAPRMSAEINLQIISKHVDEIVLVSDEEMRAAARWLWFEHGVAAELSGAASVAALLAGRYKPRESERICALVCGAGSDGIG